MIVGDLLIYRGMQPVLATLRGYNEESRELFLETKERVTTVGRVTVNRWPAASVQFYGERIIGVGVPPQITGPLSSLATTLRVSILALSRIGQTVRPGQPPSSISLGFGQSTEVEEGAEEALQRAIRFLLMAPDPLEPNRGGGLLVSLRTPLLSEDQVKRLVLLACTRYGSYVSKAPATSKWTVQEITPRSVQRVPLRTLAAEIGVIPLGDTVDSAPIDETEIVYSISLLHRLKTPFGTTEALTATAL